MLRYYYETKDGFEDGLKTIFSLIISFGATLTILEFLFFVFPTVIGYLFAGLILLTGIASLCFAYKVWNMRKKVFGYKYPFSKMRFESPSYRKTRIFIFQ